MGVTESEAGRYDCRLGADTLCSYNITVDTARCAAPSKSHDYQKVYSDWCHEFEKYKMAMKTWERRQLVTIVYISDFFVFLDLFLYFIHLNSNATAGKMIVPAVPATRTPIRMKFTLGVL